jgi:xanthine dehydrogenase large subunit
MKNIDAELHSRGQSQFINDLPVPKGLLYAAPFVSPIAHGKISRINFEKALKIPGIVDIITASQIPGNNQIGVVSNDEPLLSEKDLFYIGQPIAIIIGTGLEVIKKAIHAIELDCFSHTANFCPRKARERGELLAPPRVFSLGDCDGAWSECDLIINKTFESGGQEHLYLETQIALAVPDDEDGVKVFSSTQSPSTTQEIIASVLDKGMHLVEVEVMRLGGAFGGKEEQATPWAAMACLAAIHTGHPVKIHLERDDDLRFTGKRHPYSADYRLGLTKEGKILAYEVEFFQNGGAFADLSMPIMGRSLFHATNTYYIPNVIAKGHCCRTNLPPNTAFRGFY